MKYKCIKRMPGLDYTIGKIYEAVNDYITDDSGDYTMRASLNTDLFEKVEE